MTCSGISHDRLVGCSQRPKQCIIYARTHKSENHKYGVMEYTVKKGKIYVHVISKCLNYRGNHQATTFKCLVKQKA